MTHEAPDEQKTDVLFIHGAGEGAHAEDSILAARLQQVLGAGYQVHAPMLPETDPAYSLWRNQIESELQTLVTPVLVGHSFGGSILLQYLSEGQPTVPLAGLVLLATPFWGAPEWEVADYALPPDFATQLRPSLPIYLFHCRDDEIVPFDHLARYAEIVPQALTCAIERGGHQFEDEIKAVADSILQLK